MSNHRQQRLATAAMLSVVAFSCVQSGTEPMRFVDAGNSVNEAMRDAEPRESDASAPPNDASIVDPFDPNDLGGSDGGGSGGGSDGGASSRCRTSDDCAGILMCSNDGSCVHCIDDSDCGGHQECLAGGTCSRGCRTNEHCYEQNAHCDVASRACMGCVSDDECVPYGNLCDEVSGRCSECVVGEETCSNGLACLNLHAGPGPGECTGARLGTRTACQFCSVDSECADGYGCMRHSFKGKPSDMFCSRKKSQGAPCPAGTPSIVKAAFDSRTSRWKQEASGSQEFCLPNEAVASCHGLNFFGTACPPEHEAAGECGVQITEAEASGICVGPRGNQVCSYACKTNADCVAGACVGVSPRYCDPF